MDEWVEALVAAGVPASRINSVEEALVDPQTEARGAIVEHEHPTLGQVQVDPHAVAPRRRRDLARAAARARSASAGSTPSEVLVEVCGYADDRVRMLAGLGVFGDVEVA